ncbi:MAG: HAMP domain-containing protein [Maribacter sp.]|nr:HAMP domain-containing protein [Maribacter sp.]
MVLSVRSKILLTVLSVVMLFALFILFYYPARQTAYLLDNYNNQIENLAKTVALGVRIALKEENFEGVETAIDFVRHDDRLNYVSIIQIDTIWDADKKNFKTQKKIFSTSPENVLVDPEAVSDQHFINKSAPFTSKIMNGEIKVSFTTSEIEKGKRQIRLASAAASLTVFVIGLFIGYWLARNISKPVLALRDAAHKVGKGDLTQSVTNTSRDEIGELSIAFNKMVKDLGTARSEVNQRTQELTMEKEKSDELLLNILPLETAEELKKTGTAQAKFYDSVTVIFTDFKDFTPKSKTMSANKLVAELHDCFSRFDHIIRKHNIEKIKTIGDAYMCVAGLPVVNDTHPFEAVNAAIELRDCMLAYNQEKQAMGEQGFDVRIGIHTGPVVAGIVGVNKFAYDIWGVTVNTAARLEQSSEPNMINVSSSLYEIIKDTYDCELRGNIFVKGLGELPMYFVHGIKKLVV